MIWLISGVPGAGKSTVARALCRRYPKAVHIPVDDLRAFVISGFASPVEPWTAETTRQFVLARHAAAQMAARYSDAGYEVVIDDVVRESYVGEIASHLGGRPLVKVALLPTLAVALARNRTPARKPFDTVTLEPVIAALYPLVMAGCRAENGWTVLDTSALGPDATVDELLRRVDP